MKTLILLLFVSNWAYGDDWFCMHEAGKREGNVIWACGIGESMSEDGARHNALTAAQREFSEICDMSDDCRGKKIIVDPQRTTCQPHNGHLKCYRLLVVTLLGNP